MSECPHCGQPMLWKFGVRFQPRQAAILSMVESLTERDGGVESQALLAKFWYGEDTALQRANLRAHICMINDMLAATDWRIVNERRYRRDGAFYALKEVAA